MWRAEDELRKELKAAARRLGEASKYRSAGTIEFLVDQDTAKFYFLEVNTRLQARPTVFPTDVLTDVLTGSPVPGAPGHRQVLLP